MHREPLLQLLQEYRLRHPGEADTTDRFLDFVRREPGCFDRATSEGHVTGSAWIVDASGAKTLLTHHRKLGIWLQPGGHSDGEPDVLSVAMKEAREETGLSELTPVSGSIFDLDIHGIPARGDEPSHYHFDVRFLLRNDGSEEFTVTEESNSLAWVEMDRLEEWTVEWSMRRMRDKAIRTTARG